MGEKPQLSPAQPVSALSPDPLCASFTSPTYTSATANTSG